MLLYGWILVEISAERLEQWVGLKRKDWRMGGVVEEMLDNSCVRAGMLEDG